MKYLVEKDKRRRFLFEKNEKKILCLRALWKEKRLPFSLRLFYKFKLNRFRKNFSKTRINNRCVLTGRGRGILKFFRMSRLQIREAHWRGFLYGIRKASW